MSLVTNTDFKTNLILSVIKQKPDILTLPTNQFEQFIQNVERIEKLIKSSS